MAGTNPIHRVGKSTGPLRQQIQGVDQQTCTSQVTSQLPCIVLQ